MAFEAGLEALRKKYGPFSGWTWGSIGAAGIGAYLLFFHKKSSGNVSADVPVAPPIETTNGPGGPTDNGGGGGTTTPTFVPQPPDIFVQPPAPTPGPGVGPTPSPTVPAGNYVIETPAGSKVSVTPEALNLPKGNLDNFLHVADTQKQITETLSPQMTENQQYASILRQNVQHGLLTMNDETSYGNNQHGTVADAITFYEQNGGGNSGPAVGSANGSAAAGATQGG